MSQPKLTLRTFFFVLAVCGFAGAVAGLVGGLLSDEAPGIFWAMLAGLVGAVAGASVAMIISRVPSTAMVGAIVGGCSAMHGSVWRSLVTGAIGGCCGGLIFLFFPPKNFDGSRQVEQDQMAGSESGE